MSVHDHVTAVMVGALVAMLVPQVQSCVAACRQRREQEKGADQRQADQEAA